MSDDPQDSEEKVKHEITTHNVGAPAHKPTRFLRKMIVYPYSKEEGEAVCRAIAKGMTLNDMEKSGDFPPREAIYRWMKKYPKFHAAYVEARKQKADYHADRIEERIREPESWDRERAAAEKVAIDGHKWLAAKNNPTQYGDVGVTKGEQAPVVIIVNTGVPKKEPLPPKVVPCDVEVEADEKQEE